MVLRKKFLLVLIFTISICHLKAQLTLVGNAKDASCNSSGEVTLRASGGRSPYTYKIIANTCNETVPPSQSDPVFRSLSTCNYTFEVSDADDRKVSTVVSVGGNYLSPLVTTSVMGCSFSINVSRGSAPYKYEWSTNGGNTWMINSNSNWTQMPNGQYLIRVTDACNVSRLVSTTIALDPIEYFTNVYYPPVNQITNLDSFHINNIRGGQGPYQISLAMGKDTIQNDQGIFSWKTLPPKTNCDGISVLIKHACGTDVQRLRFSVYDIDCMSFANGTVSLKPIYAKTPINYYLYDGGTFNQSSTGVFSNLTKNNIYYQPGGNDACNDPMYIVRNSQLRTRPEIIINTKNDCTSPLSSIKIRVSPTYFNDITLKPDSYTIECTTCTPISTSPLKGNESVTINNLGVGKNTIKIKDSCGGTWTCNSELILSQFIGCDSAAFNLVNAFVCDNRPSGFSFSGDTIQNVTYTLSTDNNQVITSNSIGRFGNLIPGKYKVNAASVGCQTIESNFEIKPSNVNIIPDFYVDRGIDFSSPQRECNTFYTVYLPIEYKPYIMLDSTGKRVTAIFEDNVSGSVIFSRLIPGRYKFKSLLNCTVKEITLPDVRPKLKIVDIKPCPAGGSITLSGGQNYHYWRNYFKTFDLNQRFWTQTHDWYDRNGSSTFNYDTIVHTYFNVLPNEKVKFYLHSAFFASVPPSTCPMDSIEVVMPAYIAPTLRNNFGVICGSGNEGILQFKVNNGTSPYSLQRKNAAFSTNIGSPIASADSVINYSNLPVGTHYFTLTDACGNTANIQSTLTALDSIAAIKNCDGSITLSFYKLKGAEYNWKKGAVTLSDSSNLIIKNPANGDVYDLTFIFNNCQTIKRYTVNTATIISFTSTIISSKVSNYLCPGDTITLMANLIGSTPSQFSWNDGDTSKSKKITSAGTYTIRAKNNLGCETNANIQIEGGETVIVELNKKDISCFGKSDGSVTTKIIKGVVPFTFKWNNGSINSELQNIGKGVFRLEATDAKGCMSIISSEILEPTALLSNVFASQQLCKSVVNGKIRLEVSGGIKPYSYQWNNGKQTNSLDSLAAGDYSVQIKDANGCTLDMSSKIAVGPDLITNRIDSVCHGGSIRIGNSVFNQSGIYSVKLKSNQGCDSIINLQLIVRDSLNYTISTKQPDCFKGANASITVNSTIPLSLMINGATFNGNVVNNLRAGDYQIRMTDRNGCRAEQSVKINNPDSLFIKLINDTTINYGDSIQLGYTFNGNIRDILSSTFKNIAAFGGCANCSSIGIRPESSTSWTAEVVTNKGCKLTDAVNILVDLSYKVFIPNVFTPNGTSNNKFTIYGGGQIEKVEYLRIYNRWGDLLFSESNLSPNDLNQGWDGTFKNRVLETGLYIYVATILFKDGEKKIYKGGVTLLK